MLKITYSDFLTSVPLEAMRSLKAWSFVLFTVVNKEPVGYSKLQVKNVSRE